VNPTTAAGTLEGAFYEYMHSQGQVNAEANRRTLEFYVPRFAHCRHVLDVGCGEGQFIEALQAQGIHASGVDVDTQMVQVCRDKGLDVVKADLFDYLPQHAGEFDGILASNVIEHLTIQDTLRLLSVAFDTLRPGGILLLATPNPESLIVHLYEFWRDATHIRMYNRSLLEFLLSWAGFRDIQSGENSVTAWSPSAELQNVPRLLEDLPHWRGIAPLGGGAQSPSAEGSPPQRKQRSSRQRLVHFLLQTAFSQEYRALTDYLANLTSALQQFDSQLVTWRATIQQVGSALHHSESGLLAAPREIFALGLKPATPSEETR